jgi:hypothetical protein
MEISNDQITIFGYLKLMETSQFKLILTTSIPTQLEGGKNTTIPNPTNSTAM